MKRRRAVALQVAAVAMVASVVIGLCAGAAQIPVSRVLWLLAHPSAQAAEPEAVILWEMRLPRVLVACLAGAALGVAGAMFQALFRNPMADPYIIGASSGAGLGAVLAMLWWSGGHGCVQGLRMVPLAAFVGALGAVVLAYLLARTRAGVQMFTLLLSGVSVNAFLSAMVSMVIYFAGKRLHEMIIWLMGGFVSASWPDVVLVAPYVLVGSGLAYLKSRELNAMALGEETAHVTGIDVGRTRLVIVGVASVLTAAAVAAGGLIGFVGLVVPHVLRIVGGAEHRYLIPASFFGGGALLVLADTLSRVVIAPTELPVGVITALLGGPFFAWVLRRTRAKGQV
ncbi:MAG: FecCD family ABC transporter permease [Bacillota bacterium]